MSGIVIAVGLALLIGLSVTVGVVLAGESDYRRRQRLEDEDWRLRSWERELISAAERRGCPCCELLRRRADLQRGPLN